MVLPPLTVMVGFGYSITVRVSLEPEHPDESVTATQYGPPVVTVIDGVDAPVFHRYEANPVVALKTMVSPVQSELRSYKISGRSRAPTLTAIEMVVSHVPPSGRGTCTNTLITPDRCHVTDTADEDCPTLIVPPLMLHKYVAPPMMEVLYVIGAALHAAFGPARSRRGRSITMMRTASLVPTQSFESTTVNEYVPSVVTVMKEVVSPVDHR